MYSNTMLSLDRARRHRENHHQTGHDQTRRQKRDKHHAAPTGGELPPNNPILALKVAMEPDEEDQDPDPDKRGA